ncbi:MAG: DNA polymerase III subunit beta [Caldimicrobium sp.]
MLAKIDKNRLEKLLKRADGVADKKASMAVLSMALLSFEPEKGLLYITTTDLEQGFKGKISATVEGDPLSICVPCRKFYEVIKAMDEDEIILQKEDTRLVIKDEEENSKFELAITDSEEFPSLPEFVEENLLDIPGKVLAELIDKTIFCASKEEARFVLGGVYFEPLKEEGKLRAVASDGHRLALLDRDVPGIEDSNLSEGFIVGRKGADMISELAEDELVVKFGFVNNYAVLFFSDGFFFSRTLEGTFPDYRAVIPQEFQNILKIDRKLFLNALDRATVLITEKFKPIKIDFSSNELLLSSPESEAGKAEIKLRGEYQGSPLSVTFNAEYLISALEHMKSEEIEMKLNDERSPCLITGYRDEGFLYLLMPMVI